MRIKRGNVCRNRHKKILKLAKGFKGARSRIFKVANIAVMKAKCIKPNIKLGICGEHGGDPKSVMFCHYIGLNYVSASPYRIPVAALAAAKAQIFSQNFL